MRTKNGEIWYQHKVTGEKIQLWKVTPCMWYRLEGERRIFMKKKDLEEYKFLKKESKIGGWHNTNANFFRG
jgi:hypothetical protein